jgi:hypothetical protein
MRDLFAGELHLLDNEELTKSPYSINASLANQQIFQKSYEF